MKISDKIKDIIASASNKLGVSTKYAEEDCADTVSVGLFYTECDDIWQAWVFRPTKDHLDRLTEGWFEEVLDTRNELGVECDSFGFAMGSTLMEALNELHRNVDAMVFPKKDHVTPSYSDL